MAVSAKSPKQVLIIYILYLHDIALKNDYILAFIVAIKTELF